MKSTILDTGEHQTFLDSQASSTPNDVSEKNEADKKRKEERNDQGSSEHKTKRDSGCRDVFKRLVRAFLEGVFRNLGDWIIDAIRND